MIKQLLEKIKDDTLLSRFLNQCLESLDMAMIFSAPRTFDSTTGEDGAYGMQIYGQLLVFEEYTHKLVIKVNEIIKTIDLYQSEFSFKWKFYASAERLDAINNGLGEESDYNDDGTILTVGISDEQLVPYSVINRLYDDSSIDIVQSTFPNDLDSINAIMATCSSMTPTDMFRSATGEAILPYKQDENGNMVQMTADDVELSKANKMANADINSDMLIGLCGAVQFMFSKVKALDKNQDNERELKEVRRMARDILHFRIDRVLEMPGCWDFLKTLNVHKKEEQNGIK